MGNIDKKVGDLEISVEVGPSSEGLKRTTNTEAPVVARVGAPVTPPELCL